MTQLQDRSQARREGVAPRPHDAPPSRRARHVEILAAAARKVVETHRVDESWLWTLPDEYQERERDPWLR